MEYQSSVPCQQRKHVAYASFDIHCFCNVKVFINKNYLYAEVHSLINSKYIMASSFNDKTIPLADFCLYPSGEQYVAVEIKALQNAHLNLVTDDGLTSYYYQVVIGGTNNTRAFIRKRSPTDMGHKTQVMLRR